MKTSDALFAKILAALQDCESYCLDNGLEQKLTAARVVEALTDRKYNVERHLDDDEVETLNERTGDRGDPE